MSTTLVGLSAQLSRSAHTLPRISAIGYYSSRIRRHAYISKAIHVCVLASFSEHVTNWSRTYTLRLYSAGLIIATQIPLSLDDNESSSLLESLLKCINLLEQSKDLNVVAGKAVEHLNTFALGLDTR